LQGHFLDPPGSKGQNIICPKDDGHSCMISVFISQAWSFDIINLPERKLCKINACRQNQHHLSIKSAMEINYCTAKKDIKDAAPFVNFLSKQRAHKEGYWKFHHAVLQLEDVVHCLAFLFSYFDFNFFDQISGHGKQQKDGLCVCIISKYWGGASPTMYVSCTSECVIMKNGIFCYLRIWQNNHLF